MTTPSDEGVQEAVEQVEVDETPSQWQSIYDKLPVEFQEQIRPDLEAYEQKYQEELARYQPYEDLAKYEVDPELITRSLQMYKAVDTNPQGFYVQLGNLLGVSPEQAQQITEDAVEEVELDESEEFRGELGNLRAEVEATRQAVEARALAEETAIESAKIQRELDDLREKHGPYSERAVMEKVQLQIAANEPIDLQRAHAEYMQMVNEIRNQRPAGESAPLVIPTGGGVPLSTAKPIAEMNFDERAAYFKARLDAANA